MLLPIKINSRRVILSLLVLFAIAGLVVVTRSTRTGCGGRNMRVRGDFSSIIAALKMYRINNGELPPTSAGLDALINRPANLLETARWTRLLDDLPRDPWGTPYQYIKDGSAENGFRLFSMGQDLRSSSLGNDPDDIATWDASRSVPKAFQPSRKAVVFLLISGVFLAGGLAGIFLKSRPERLFVFAN